MLFDVLLVALATVAMTFVWRETGGPFGLLEGLRRWLVGRSVVLLEMFGCPWCLGFWVALMMALLYWAVPYGSIVVVFFAVYGLAGILLEVLERIRTVVR